MAKKRKISPPQKAGGLPLWLGTFGDLMSLILTFFILLLSMATFDKEKVQQAVGSVQGALSILEHGVETEITPPSDYQATPLQSESQKVEVLNVFASLLNEYSEMTEISDGVGIDLEEAEDGFIIRIPDDLLFSSGGVAIVNPSGRVFLERVAMEVERFRDILSVRIVGNTDNVPFRTGSAIDNWDLSNKRALSVANALLALKVPSEILQVGGDADFNPVADNASAQGRAKNRRVDLNFSFVGVVDDKKEKANEIINKLTQTNKNAESALDSTKNGAESTLDSTLDSALDSTLESALDSTLESTKTRK